MAAADQANLCSQLDLKLISLNISGLRNKTCFLKHIMYKHKPDIVCLQETNICEDYYKYKALYDLGLDNDKCFFNYPINRSNGTAILCISPDFKINDTLYLDNGRTTIVQLQKGNIKFTIVNVYAPTSLAQRPNYFIDLLTHLEIFKIVKI